MVERATGVTFREYVSEHVFARPGMHRSGFFRMDVVEPDVAEGVEAIRAEDGSITGWQRNIYSYPSIDAPDGGAHVTAGNLFPFHDAPWPERCSVPNSRPRCSRRRSHIATTPRSLEAETRAAHLMGYGLNPRRCLRRGAAYWKEGVNFERVRCSATTPPRISRSQSGNRRRQRLAGRARSTTLVEQGGR
jgi:CubicO group peptidase (beta-lactamase class C family)